MSSSKQRVVIIGGGLAGLACARALSVTDAEVAVLEAADRVGGRVATDVVDGHLIDRGFQVLLTSYSEIDRQLDRNALDLRPFERGALVRTGGRFVTIADPFAKPLKAPRMAFSGLIRPRDAIATLRLLRDARSATSRHGADCTIAQALTDAGVSEQMLEGFWRPFLAGITLDSSLSTSKRFLDFLLTNFASGPAAVPNAGMGRIPEVLAAQLPPGTVRTGIAVKSIEKGSVRLEHGASLKADHIVIATDGTTAAKLASELVPPRTRTVGQISFSCGARPPVEEAMLVLDGDHSGPVNNFQVISNAASGYAPAGSSLATCSILEEFLELPDDQLERKVRAQMTAWFGGAVYNWKTLDIQRVEQALPIQPAGSLDPLERPLRLRRWLWVAGDHRSTASIEGAMASGRHAGEQIAATIAEQSGRLWLAESN